MLLLILLMLIQQDCLKNREAIARALRKSNLSHVGALRMQCMKLAKIAFYVPIMHSAYVAISQGCCRAKLNPHTHPAKDLSSM